MRGLSSSPEPGMAEGVSEREGAEGRMPGASVPRIHAPPAHPNDRWRSRLSLNARAFRADDNRNESSPPEDSTRMASRTEIRWMQLQRAGWMLWAATFALLLTLTTVVPALYARVLGLT